MTVRKATNTLAVKIFFASALIILATLALIGSHGYWQSRRAIETEVQKHVYGVMSERRARLEAWFEERRRDIDFLTGSPVVIGIVSQWARQDASSADSPLSQLVNLLERHRMTCEAYVYCGIISTDGSVIAHVGNYSEEDAPTGLTVVQKALNGMYSFGQVHLDRYGIPVMNFASPIHDKDGKLLAIYLCQMSTAEALDPILTDTIGLGRSGESFLVGADTVMLTPSRFHSHPLPLTHKMPIPAVLAALSGRNGVMIYTGFLGQDVVGAYTYLPDQKWALITEMVTAEAFSPLRTIARNSIFVAIIALVMMLVLAVMLSRNWTRPIKQLADASLRVAQEDFTVALPEDKRQDEIGTLTRQFNRMVASLRDSREKIKQSHAQLVQSEKLAAIGQLATGIVHEMRNPLSVIKMNLRFLQRRFTSPDDSSVEQIDPVLSEQINLASLEAERLEKMLSELLEYSKPVSVQCNDVSVNRIIENCFNIVKTAADSAGVKLVSEVDSPEETMICVDEDLIVRILTNLLMNAIQASSSGKEVVLSGERTAEGTIIFEVRDNGAGMSDRVRDRVFDPFFTTREEGTGLGMPNVKKFIEAIDALIEVESEEGEGTLIRIILPGESNG